MDISIFGIGSVAAITVLCYLVGSGAKTTPLDNKYIPVICGCTGLVLGLVAMYAGMPEFPATDPITAAAVGAVSGLAATGINQAVKQLGKQYTTKALGLRPVFLFFLKVPPSSGITDKGGWVEKEIMSATGGMWR